MLWDTQPRRECFLSEVKEEEEEEEDAHPGWLSQLHRDLEVADGLSTVFEKRAETVGGRACVRRLLASAPLDDAAELGRRQASLRALEGRGLGDAEGDDAALSRAISEREDDVRWFLSLREDEPLRSMYESAYFGVFPLTSLNLRSPLALVALNVYRIVFAPIVGVLTPVVYFLIPYLVICRARSRAGLGGMGFAAYLSTLVRSAVVAAFAPSSSPGNTPWAPWVKLLSMLFSIILYLHGVFSSFQVSAAVGGVCRTLCERVDRATEFVRLTAQRSASVGLFSSFSGDLRWLGVPAGVACCEPPSHSQPKRGPFGYYRALGENLRDAAAFDLDAAEGALRTASALDALSSVLRARRDLGMCWAEFVEAEHPVLDLKGLAHPVLLDGNGKGGVRTNDWALSSSPSKRSSVLTGPNAGGKSTLLKSALLSALMAQTLTIAPCSTSAKLTPFALISSHINVADSAGYESLFQAEMARAHRVIAALGALTESTAGKGKKKNKNALVVIDEIFSSTNPVEGPAAAAAVARRIASHPGAVLVVSTHFLRLCRWLRRDGFAMVQMPVEKTAKNEKVRHPYVLRRGVCRQQLAIELLRDAGFDEALIEDARACLHVKHSSG